MSAEFWGYFFVFCGGILVGRFAEYIRYKVGERRKK